MRGVVRGAVLCLSAAATLYAALLIQASPVAAGSPNVSVYPTLLEFPSADSGNDLTTHLLNGSAENLNVTWTLQPATGYSVNMPLCHGGGNGIAPAGSACDIHVRPSNPPDGDVILTITWTGAKGGSVSPDSQPVTLRVKPAPAPSPTPTPVATPQGSLSLDPAAAPAGSSVKLTGTGFPAGQSFSVNLDGSEVTQAAVDANGAIAIVLTIPAQTPPGGHVVCVNEPAGNLCANLTVQPAPSPSASASPSPSPSPSPADAVPPASSGGTGSLSLLGTLTRPPFVFFPILLLLALVCGAGYLLWARRPGLEISEVTIEHRAPTLREYEGLPAASSAPAEPEPPGPAPIHYESAEPPRSAPPARDRPPSPPSGADVPPDLPEASD